MNLLSFLGISDAHAATTTVAATAGAHPPQPGLLGMLPWLVAFIAIFYFLLVRPQSKRAKEHRQLLDHLSISDEIMTTGGIAGRITKLRDTYAVLNIAKDVDITIQKSAIATILPKGTLENIN